MSKVRRELYSLNYCRIVTKTKKIVYLYAKNNDNLDNAVSVSPHSRKLQIKQIYMVRYEHLEFCIKNQQFAYAQYYHKIIV